MIFLGVILLIVLAIAASRFVQPRGTSNPNANEPDVFASPEADLDPQSDTGESEKWN